MEPVIELRKITKSFFDVKVLHNVDLAVGRGEIHALLGENGAGKSTLMKILSGLYPASSGKIIKDGEPVTLTSVRDAQKHGINTIFQELSLISNMNTWQNIFLGREKFSKYHLDKRYMRKKARSILLSLEIDLDIDLPVCNLSIANRQFVEIAKALLEDSDVLILDEPTSTLTPNEVEHLFNVMRRLRDRGVAMIFISHHLDELFEICQRVTILRDGNCVGVYQLAELNQKQLISLMVGRENTTNYPNKREIPKNPQDLFRVGPEPARQSGFQVRRGEILGVFGLVGAGRTELMLKILGLRGKYGGTIDFKGKPVGLRDSVEALKLGIGLLPEDRKFAGLMLNTSVFYNTIINNIQGFFFRRNRERTKAIQSTRKIHVKSAGIDQEVKYLSGGNQQKVIIARCLCANCELLIFDEPTRGIDVGAKHEIYNLMDQFVREGNAIIMISSEMNELVGMSDRIIVMKNDEITATLNADFEPKQILANAI